MRTNKRMVASLVFAILVPLLSACQPTLDVSLASAEEVLPAPRFTIADRRTPGARPLYDTIKLSNAAGEILWHLRAEPFGTANSVAVFAYGEDIPGFAVVVAAKPLEPNQEYILGVIGEAFGTFRFRVDAAGKIHGV